MTQAAGRKRALIGLTASALFAFGVFAPAASAQIDDLTGTVDSTTTKVTDTVKDTVDSGSTTTGSTTTKITDTTDSTTTTVTDTVDKVGSDVDSSTGTTTYTDTKKTVGDTTTSTTGTLEDAAGTVGQTVEDTSGGLVSSPLDKKDGKKSAGGSTKTGSKKTGTAGTRQSQLAAARDIRDRVNARLASVTASERNRGMGPVIAAVAIAPPQRESFFTQLAEAAGEAAKKLAFPLGLALMVGAFLMIQGRIDRKDAKLALAPIDSEQDLLSFQ